VGRYVVKLGSNIVARDDGALRADVLAHICGEIAERHAAGDDVVIVTSGAIARGIEVMGLGGRPVAMADLQAASAVGQGKLYRVYDELLRERGVTSAQVLLTFFDVGHRAHYLNARQTLGRLLDWRVVPVVNENDTTATEEISFGDNDFLAAQVAILVGADRLVLLTNQDGLHAADPRTQPGAPLVREVRDVRELEEFQIGQSPSALGSGGMRSKVVAAEMATAAGIPTTICSGLREGVLARVLAGEQEGTRFAPQKQRHSSFELWLKYAKPSHGTIVIDGGAARALREGGASLLPVGVVGVEGSFQEGDAVEVRDWSGTIGKGIANYAADDLRRVMGSKSDAIRVVLPRAADEAVHRDYFVLS
jgi:glutamate 5-kinase